MQNLENYLLQDYFSKEENNYGDLNYLLNTYDFVLLKYQKSPAAFEIHKTIESAIANAKDLLIPGLENLKINEIYANQGTTLKRWRAAARGRPGTFNHPTSHIVVKLSE